MSSAKRVIIETLGQCWYIHPSLIMASDTIEDGLSRMEVSYALKTSVNISLSIPQRATVGDVVRLATRALEAPIEDAV